MRLHKLPYSRQTIDDADVAAVVQALQGEYLTTGPTVTEFEEEMARYVGARYAVAFSSGTAALHGAAFAVGIQPGDEVITSPMTFAATANSILYLGGKPVFADILPDTYNINPESVKSLITSRTKAILPVHYAGQPADMDAILQIAEKREIAVIEDAAHALGSSYKGKRVGSLSDITVFSFHPVKPITCGEGGVATTDDSHLYERLKLFRNHGITRNPQDWSNAHGSWYYEMQHLGYNYRLTDIQAALGLSQLPKLNTFVARRTALAKRYSEIFSNHPALAVPFQQAHGRSGWHLYVLRLRLERLTVGRDSVVAALLAENIGANVHFLPVYRHPYYQRLGYAPGLCPVAEDVYERILSLPLFPSMTDDDAQDVILAVQKVVDFYGRDAG